MIETKNGSFLFTLEKKIDSCCRNKYVSISNRCGDFDRKLIVIIDDEIGSNGDDDNQDEKNKPFDWKCLRLTVIMFRIMVVFFFLMYMHRQWTFVMVTK